MYETSVKTNNVWAARLAAYADINSLAIQTNAPGNDVFESRDLDETSARLDVTYASFTRAIEHARQELRLNLAADVATSILPHLNDAEVAMRIQVTQARTLFDYIRSKDLKSAGEQMAAMDHAFYDVSEALASLNSDIQGCQQGELEEQAVAAISMRRIEYLIAALIAVMVSLACLYGHKLAERAKKTESHTQTLIKSIEVSNLELEGQKEEAEAMNADLININKALEIARTDATQATKAKSDFLANMSHEIRTPMTAILGYAENLLDADIPESDRVNSIHTIRRNGLNLLAIINDILDLSKIEAGKMTVECIKCNPCQIIAEVATLMKVRTDAKSLPLKVEYIGNIPQSIQCDPARLRQILINLLGNAIKFTETGSVQLVTRFVSHGDKPFLQFDVIDTGRGMTSEQKSKLFESFVQADNSTTRLFGGTGLGLAISKRFAQLLGGDLTVFASEINAGSTFRVTINPGLLDGVRMIKDPYSLTTVTNEPVTPTLFLQSQLKNSRILYAEDGPDNQQLISFILKKAGADVTVMENGKLALDAALVAQNTSESYDCILMDMQMPVMDGYEATEQLRQRGYTGPIIALTANAMDSDREKCLKAGCNDYESKPIDRSSLIATIIRHLAPAKRYPLPSTSDKE